MSHPRKLIVAIDGPAGAGKSTVAKRLARALGYRLLDTGAIYRSIALTAKQAGISWTDEEGLAELARALEVRFDFRGELNHVFVAGEDVTEAIRTPAISEASSQVSGHPAVRQALLELQRRLAAGGGIVAEGRDVGTVVFPAAHAKFFVTASDEVRARRRFEELRSKGAAVEYDATLAELRARDERDTSRAVAPLVAAHDAILVDTSQMAADAVIEFMLREVRRRESVTQHPEQE